MRSDFKSRLAYSAIAGALFPTLAMAAPSAQLDKSASYVFGNEVRAFRVPTTDSTGKIKYYDVVIKLTVGSTGVISSVAAVTATLSPVPATTLVIVPGTYKASDGALCSVTNLSLTSGRIQHSFSCKIGDQNIGITLASGPVTQGHPYYSQLAAAGVDKLADVNTYTWGLVTQDSPLITKIGGCGDFEVPYIIGAKTNGGQLILALYDNVPFDFKCNGVLVKQ